MKTFMAVYVGTPEAHAKSGWDKLSDADRKAREQEGMKAWYAWGEKHKDALVDHGGPLGKTKLVSKAGIEDIRNQMAGYNVVRAESHEAAARLFENHPHFTIFPGSGVEIMEVLPIPTMG
jgi:hypothetical protein